MFDVIVVGGGVIGLSIANQAALQSLKVLVIEQGELGREASWAGAGMLPPGNIKQATTPESRLRSLSDALWNSLSAQLREETGIDNGYRRCGGLELGFPDNDETPALFKMWQTEGVTAHKLEGGQLQDCEPYLSPELSGAVRLPDMAQVRNPHHLKALIAACAQQGVTFQQGDPVLDFEQTGSRVTGVRTRSGILRGDQIVITAGAWSQQLMAQAGCPVSLIPVKGQIVLFRTQSLPFRHVLCLGSQYLVPRPDGRVLAGSTEEYSGFDKRTTASGVGGLISLALKLVPILSEASFEKAWSGLRPRTQDDLPFLGHVPGWKNLLVAAGHFRSGLQMSAATGVLMTELLLGRPTSIDLAPYACERAAHQAQEATENRTG